MVPQGSGACPAAAETIEAFVERMLPLLDMERDAEMEQQGTPATLMARPARHPLLACNLVRAWSQGEEGQRAHSMASLLSRDLRAASGNSGNLNSSDNFSQNIAAHLAFSRTVLKMSFVSLSVHSTDPGCCFGGAGEALTKLSPEAAQARGLCNLRCSNTSGGLLGRTLLTLVSNKARCWPGRVWGLARCTSSSEAPLHCHNKWALDWICQAPRRHSAAVAVVIAFTVVFQCLARKQVQATQCRWGNSVAQGPASGKEVLPLPAHKFGPHDIVAVRPSKRGAGGPPLAQGVVYRLHETSVVVAVDEAPDDGLDQPLRLEKLANTVGTRGEGGGEGSGSSGGCGGKQGGRGTMPFDV